ncbi:hypothetical protein POX_a01380 [Penicillium oxalicum]|uniref:hypothetical protein n=1 Tax=Penicillium oxalicum TaxID=69781 RepID=UPI0020B64133|nr:hypothetical protein POX_a01380 [Penicillium oxalicum]KAI2794779.1 hypothetical protein POX_a01380 [Penicillium oxalicum]
MAAEPMTDTQVHGQCFHVETGGVDGTSPRPSQQCTQPLKFLDSISNPTGTDTEIKMWYLGTMDNDQSTQYDYSTGPWRFANSSASIRILSARLCRSRGPCHWFIELESFLFCWVLLFPSPRVPMVRWSGGLIAREGLVQGLNSFLG